MKNVRQKSSDFNSIYVLQTKVYMYLAGMSSVSSVFATHARRLHSLPSRFHGLFFIVFKYIIIYMHVYYDNVMSYLHMLSRYSHKQTDTVSVEQKMAVYKFIIFSGIYTTPTNITHYTYKCFTSYTQKCISPVRSGVKEYTMSKLFCV